jgi:hypothetical protein
VRYCETLIQVREVPGDLSIAEPVALGFASREHPAANRIRRLMDSKLLRRDRLRVSAIAVTLLLGLCCFCPAWHRTNARCPKRISKVGSAMEESAV